MLFPQLEPLDDIQATKQYQNQLEVVYQIIADNHYQQLTLLIDLNAYGAEVFNVLDCGVDLPFERIKRIHHTFSDDLVVVNIQLGNSTGKRLLEQLLALAIYENTNDIAGRPHSRSICLWLFEQPITEKLKQNLYLIGQAYGLGSNKRRYLRYWDPRVIQLLPYLWTSQQKLQVYQLGLPRMHCVDWNNTFTEITLPTPSEVYPSDTQVALEQLRPLPFRFNQQQWHLLEQTEWVNMIVRQLKEQMVINVQSYKTVLSQALLIAQRQITQQQAVRNIVKGLEQPRSQGVAG